MSLRINASGDKHMNPIVAEYLKNHSFEQLEQEHGVCSRPSTDLSKFSINYDQILSKNGNRALSGQCRGMVIRPRTALAAGDWRSRIVGDVDVLAWPMNRFYNASENEAAKIDWSDPKLVTSEKLDGTCCIVYWDSLRNDWCVATRSVCEADVPVEPPDDVTLPEAPFAPMTFASLFWYAVCETTNGARHDWTARLDKRRTYVFELTTPWNVVVIKHTQARVYLLAARDVSTGVEVDPYSNDVVEVRPVPNAPTWPNNSLDMLVAIVNMKDHTLCEGAVVRDSSMNRVKVKNPGYTLSSRMKDALRVSRYEVVRQIILGKADDIAAALSGDLLERFVDIVNAVERYFARVDATFMRLKSHTTRKDFAIAVHALNELNGPYFSMWEGKATSAAGWARCLAECDRLTRSTLDYIVSQLE